MNSTPQKLQDTSLNTSLTPVRFLESQRVQSPGNQTSQDSNLSICRARLETLVKNLQDNYAKWQLAQQRGTTLCYAIEAKKTRCLEKTDSGSTCYPDDLKTPCAKLAIITSIFVDISNNTREALRQLRALQKLTASASDIVFYRTWQLRQFVAFVGQLQERYAQEAAIKQQVMRNIAHCTQRSELIAYTTDWEFPAHIDAYVNLGFLLLAEELRSK